MTNCAGCVNTILWVDKYYSKQTKENPADIRLGINLPEETAISSIAKIGDDRDM